MGGARKILCCAPLAGRCYSRPALGGQQLVTGSTKFFTPNGYFDLATLQPGVGNPEVLANDKYSADVV